MKRPLAVFGLTYLATSAAAVCLVPEANFILCVTAVILAIAACFIWREKIRDILLILSPICLALIVIGCCQWQAMRLSDSLGNENCLISGEICEIPRRQYGRWRYVIMTDSVDLPGVRQNIRILVTSRNSIEEAREGDRLTCRVNFIQSSDDHGYSSTTSLRADGISARAWLQPYSEFSLIRGKPGLKYLHMSIRRAVTAGIRKALPADASAMLCGMLLGDTDYMDITVVENFRSTGIAHLLAVSGLHLTLLTLSLEEILRRLRRNRKTSSAIVIGFIIGFMAVIGFPPSVVRSGIMHIISQAAKFTNRNAEPVTSMSIAVMIMCLMNPWAAADIGLQLSVCSTLSLLLTARKLNREITDAAKKLLIRFHMTPRRNITKRLGKLAIHSVSNSLSSSIAIIPLTAIHFGRLSIVSPLTNLLCVYMASVFIILGIIASVIYCIPLIGWIVSFPLRFATALIGVYLKTIAGAMANLPFSEISTDSSSTPYFIMLMALITGSAALMSRLIHHVGFSRRIRGFALCEIAVLLFAAVLSNQIFGRGPEILIFDANNGGMCVCAKNRTHAVLAEAGGDRYDISVIKETLCRKGVNKVDAVAISDNSKTRSGNLNRILDLYSPDCLITGSDNNTGHFRTCKKVVPFESSCLVNSMQLRIDTFTDTQGNHWQLLTCKGMTALICPENGNCSLLPDEWRECDAAVIGKDISGLAALNVGAIIIASTGQNTDTMTSRLKSMGFRHIYATSSDGMITLSLRKGKLCVQKTRSS